MSFNTFGKLFRFTTWGESHGPAIGCVVDGCPPNIAISEKDIQIELNKRRPGQSKFVTQRKEKDQVQILSGVFQGKTTGTPFALSSITAPHELPAFLISNKYCSHTGTVSLSGQKKGFFLISLSFQRL